MKSVLLLCFLVAVVAFTHSSRIEKDGVFDKVQAYERQRAIGLRMTRGGPNERSENCYGTYNSKIAQLNGKMKTESEACIKVSDSKRNKERGNAQLERSKLGKEVSTIWNSMIKCKDAKDAFKDITCLMNGAKKNQVVLAAREERTLELLKQLNQTYEAIQKEENLCIDSLNKTALRESVMHDLQNCLKNKYAQN